MYTEIFNEIVTESIENIKMVMNGDGNFYEKYKKDSGTKSKRFLSFQKVPLRISTWKGMVSL